ncbi:sushi domain-containing protein 2-like [Hydra vulgaris]|uniref:Sushi domain-containing protein 2-like n=1 Tax=Hydra vulgaris TaxID=6087 RepID=A0ABM4C631_HYDVU
MITLWSVILLVNTVGGVIQITDFYPYGSATNDQMLERRDDASTMISISFEYPFFGSVYREVYLSTNGIITFGAANSEFVPKPFPLPTIQSVATYWTDSDPSKGGNIFYKETTNKIILKKISEEIKYRLVSYMKFNAEWALIVTYDQVRPYSCGCNTSCSNYVTYQTILTSDGVNSFAIFNFNQLGYFTGAGSCAGFAQVGFNAGDGKRFFLMPKSNTAGISEIALFQSNVGVPGKWIFSTDANNIIEQCNTKGQLEIFPRKVLYFGACEIRISGVCYEQNKLNVSVLIDDVSVQCFFGQWQNLHCRVPFLKKLGKIDIFLEYNFIKYKSFIISVGRDDNMVIENINNFQSSSNLDGEFTLVWDPRDDDQQIIEFSGFQIDYYINNQGKIVVENITTLQYGQFSNNGRVYLRPALTPSNQKYVKLQLIRSIFLAGYFTSTSIIAAMIIKTATLAATMHCSNWYYDQSPSSKIRSIVEDLNQRKPCLPGIPPNFPIKIENYVIDESCNPNDVKNRVMCETFHPGAKGCYRRTKNEGDPVVQCCYANDYKLLLGKPAGGTLGFGDLEINTMDHFKKDVLPFITCCKIGVNRCDKYYEKRPSINPRPITPIIPRNANGDPHFTTMDGTFYSFNPVGEFVYLTTQNGSDIIQSRISQYIDKTGIKKNACIFSGFVIKGNDSDIIQIELNNKQTFVFIVNGQSLNLDFGLWNFNGISLSYENNATVVVQTNSGIQFEIIALENALHTILVLSDTFKNRISGLIGDWDGNSSNDLKLPNGSFISSNSSNYNIHFNFGMLWSTSNKTSLFTYPNGLSWFDYQDQRFVPDFSTPIDYPQCNGSKACNYDIQVTGNVEFGMSNLVILKRTIDLKQTYQNIVQTCPTNISVLNGNVEVKVNGSLVQYSLICNDGFNVTANKNSTCVSGSYTPIGFCDYSNFSKRLDFVSSHLIGCLIAFLIYNYFIN